MPLAWGQRLGAKSLDTNRGTVVNNMAPLSSMCCGGNDYIVKITLGIFRAVLRDDASQLVVCARCTVGREHINLLLVAASTKSTLV